MRTYLFPLAVGVVAIGAGSADALVMAMRPAPQRAVTAEVVVTGKVTAVEKETVEALPPYVGAKEKIGWTVAVVKIDARLLGAGEATHIKVGVPVPPKPQPAPPGGPGARPIRPRGPLPPLELKEGQEWLLFLAKHPSADFYFVPSNSPPIELKGDAAKKELEAVKKVTDVLSDPAKALKSDKAEARAFAATVVIQRYRSGPETGGPVDHVPLGADESKQLLKALAEGDWVAQFRPGVEALPNSVLAFHQLGLTDKDGWKPPTPPRPAPGQPPVDYNALTKEAFVKWLDGPGQDYRIKKIVPKRPEK